MKIKTEVKSYAEVLGLAPEKRKKVKKPSILFRLLVRILAIFELRKVKFSYEKIGMEKLKKEDEVAYVRFASVYREFKDLNTFLDELRQLQSDK